MRGKRVKLTGEKKSLTLSWAQDNRGHKIIK